MYEQYGFWTVDGSIDFGHMPGGIIPGIADALPIRLQHGNNVWGVHHINARHGGWLTRNNHTAASMVHLKLQQSGKVFATEAEDKTKVSMTVHPSALLVLKYVPRYECLTVVTVYGQQGRLDGELLGHYKAPPGPPLYLRPVSVYAPPPMKPVGPQKKFG